MEPSTSAEFWALCQERQRFRTEYKSYWNSLAATTQSARVPDGVILPVAPTLAVRPGRFQYYGYSAIVNALDYVSGVFPVMSADRGLDGSSAEFEPLSDLDRAVQSSCKLATRMEPVNLLTHLLSSRCARRRSWHARWVASHGAPLAGRSRFWPDGGNSRLLDR